MKQETLKCPCGEHAFIFYSERYTTAGSIISSGYEMGWVMKDGQWFCGHECARETETTDA